MEKLLWSIALPGFGQLLNGKTIQGTLFILIEILINVQANLNQVLILSFYGQVEESIYLTNYEWLLFYPCFYFFVMWDAYREERGGQKPYSFIPFVFTAYFVTIGCIYSPTFRLFGLLLGPIWLPLLFVIPGLISGNLVRFLLLKYTSNK